MTVKLYTLDNKFIEETDNSPFKFTGIVEWADGSKTWFMNGKYHRLDGHAHEHPDGTKVWFVDGKRHRLDGPAIEYSNGTKYWYVDGKYHRLDGPAYEGSDGSKYWFVDNKEVSEEQYKLLYSIMKLKGLL